MFYKGPLALGGDSGKLHYHAMAKVPKERRRDFRELAHLILGKGGTTNFK